MAPGISGASMTIWEYPSDEFLRVLCDFVAGRNQTRPERGMMMRAKRPDRPCKDCHAPTKRNLFCSNCATRRNRESMDRSQAARYLKERQRK